MTEKELFPVYETKGVKTLYADGVGVPRDESDGAGQSYMLGVAKTTKAEFGKYTAKLKKLGYKKEFSNETAKITASEWYLDGTRLYAYYSKGTRSARIIRDEASVSLDEFSYNNPESLSQIKYYQFGVPMQPDGSDIKVNGKRVNCGQIYFIKLDDNSIFLIDGSKLQSFGDDTMEEFYSLLKEVCGSEDITVRCWYITHGHNDHFIGFCRFLGKYGEHVKIERLAFNFPSLLGEEVLKNSTPDRMKLAKYIGKYCPDAKFLKPHTAQKFNICGVGAEVMYTHEDGVDPATGLTGFKDFNNTTTVIKFTFDGVTFMQLGDVSTDAQDAMLKNHTDEEMKSDGMQVAHHTWNAVLGIYDAVRAETALFPQTSGGAVKDEKRVMISEKIKTYAKRCYYAGDETTGLVASEEGLVAVDRRAVVGGDYTGWKLE